MVFQKKIAAFYVSLAIHHGFIKLDKARMTPIIYVQLHCFTGEKKEILIKA